MFGDYGEDSDVKMALLPIAMLLAACGSSGNQAAPTAPETTAVTATTLTTTPTLATKTVRQWALPSLPYVEQMQTAFDELGKATRPLSLDGVRSASQRLADASRGFRLSLESAGRVPSAAAVQGPAVIEATRDLEQKSRILAACIALSDCSPAISAETVAFASWGSAMQELTKVLNS